MIIGGCRLKTRVYVENVIILKIGGWGNVRVVFMGSPGFAVPSLKKLALSGYDIIAVYTQPDRPAGRGKAITPPAVKQAAVKMGLDVVQPENIRREAEIKRLAGFKTDLIVVCAFGQILPKAVLDLPPYRCLNVHFSLLPRHRGAAPVAAAILAGDEYTGVTVMIVTSKLDTGPVLSRAVIPISAGDDTGILTGKLSRIGADLLVDVITGWRRGEIMPVPQDEKQATYFGQIKKEESRIDWNLAAVEIWRRVRAYSPWPGCYTIWQGKQLKILEAEVRPGGHVRSGSVITTDEGKVGIGTGEGILVIHRLQLEGKKAMSAAEFARGQRDFTGSVLAG
jgi:methionyl-tRNA formyltransferase